MSEQPDFFDALQAIAPRLMKDGRKLSGLKRLSGGASQETWSFDLSTGDGRARSFILRRAPGGRADTRSENAIALEGEARLIETARTAGAPAPEITHICTPDDGLGDAFVMAKVEGETIPRKILRDDVFADARQRLAAQCGQALARIHAAPTNGPPALQTNFGLAQIAQYEAIFRGFDAPRPVFELALAWLKETAPKPLDPVLVHGDFRLGNLMVDQDGLAAILDWELAHIGDPREDLAWICVNSWRFGGPGRFAGLDSLDAFLDAYNTAARLDISPQDIDWWETLGSLKWGIMCMMMYESFRTGAEPSVERAAIGRRVSETEIDLVNLLERVAVHA